MIATQTSFEAVSRNSANTNVTFSEDLTSSVYNQKAARADSIKAEKT